MDNPTISSNTFLPINSLPLDVLAYLLQFIPEKPRLMVVSLVCKRWQSAVYRSFTSLRPKMNFSALFPRIPVINMLDLTEVPSLPSLSPLASLLHLRLCHRSLPHCTCSLLSHCTALTHLVYLLELYPSTCPSFITLLSNTRETIRELILFDYDQPTRPFPADLFLPSLQVLRLRRLTSRLYTLAILHSSQLCILDIRDAWCVEQRVTSFPQLTDLTTAGELTSSAEFLRNFPALRKLDLHLELVAYELNQHPTRVPLLVPYASFIKFRAPCAIDRATEILSTATRLTSLAFSLEWALQTAGELVQVQASRLLMLTLRCDRTSEADCSHIVRSCTRITKLHLKRVYFEAPISLPSLHYVVWTGPRNGLEEALRFLRNLLAVAPRIIAIYTLLYVTTPEDKRIFLEILQFLERSGVERLHLHNPAALVSEQASIAMLKWMRVVRSPRYYDLDREVLPLEG